MDENYKEVDFNKYCKTCMHFDKMEEEEPCYECLGEPARVDSHKPLKWEKK